MIAFILNQVDHGTKITQKQLRKLVAKSFFFLLFLILEYATSKNWSAVYADRSHSMDASCVSFSKIDGTGAESYISLSNSCTCTRLKFS